MTAADDQRHPERGDGVTAVGPGSRSAEITVLPGERRRLRELILTMGDLVDAAISQATLGLVNRDPELCNKVIAGDHIVNERQREAGEICFSALLEGGADQAALREILGFLHMASELERMADHCVNIARIGRTLADFPDLRPTVDIPLMSQYCADQVRDMLGALVARDVQRAREIAARDDRVDRVYARLLDDLLHLMVDDSSTVFRATNYILVAHNLERIADRVTNLAEDLVFVESGAIQELG
jgi:phosphate transport system protein